MEIRSVSPWCRSSSRRSRRALSNSMQLLGCRDDDLVNVLEEPIYAVAVCAVVLDLALDLLDELVPI
eukprot:3478902-Pyramimonas_sp.AAC.1